MEKEMRPLYVIVASIIILALILSGCDVMRAVAPPPQSTIAPTETITPIMLTATPTFGAPEYIDTAYCWESHIDESEFNLIRFFSNGKLIDVFVQPYQDCPDAWSKTESYLTLDSLEKFNHGEYYLSGDRIKITLIKANSSEEIGEVYGTYLVDKMLLQRQGAEEWEYTRVWKVKNGN
jgi:hypothetical protein